MNARMHVAGWVLVHFVWQGAAIALVAAVVLHACRHHSASMRYLVACGAMIAMLLGVTLTAALVDAPMANVERTPASATMTANGSDKVLLPIPINPSEAASASAGYRIDALLPWIVSAWLVGVLLLLARVMAGWWRVRRLHQLALSSMRSSWQHAADRIAGRLGLARATRIVELSGVDVPVVVGCLRRLSCCRSRRLAQLTQPRLRRSSRTSLRTSAVTTISSLCNAGRTAVFYHPASGGCPRVSATSASCCDDVAVAVCGMPLGTRQR